ncbi:MAG: class I SAM-dependent methyltransferase [Candidatus Thorarchaeota archaeon]|nr:MAG: class I SAM-dependent methyltransferase [Candidatus Thorarchaeota archaeon]
MSKVTNEKIRAIYSTTAHRYQMLLKIYLALGVNLAKWRRDAFAGLPDMKKPRILDVGTGTGANLPFLIEKYPDYESITGIDYTPAMLTQAARRLKDNGWENIHLHLVDAREMSKVVKGCFDLIVSTYSLSITPDSLRVLDEMKNHACDDGYIMLLDCQKFKGILKIYNPLAIFLSTRLGGNSDTYAVPVSETASRMFNPIHRKLMYSGMFYEDLYQMKKST